MGNKLTTEMIINSFQNVHGLYYDYSLVKYNGTKSKVIIICPLHGEFEQRADIHKMGHGCIKCKIHKHKESDIINKFKEIHGDKYDYSKVNYNGAHLKITIICPIHGEFEQRPCDHKYNGCSKCSYTLNSDSVIKSFKKVHGDKYDYSKINYIGTHHKIEILCPIHGSFSQKPATHKIGSGCPMCKESHGEKMIKKMLDENNIKYVQQKRFNDCRNIRPLPFDFYLPEHNICIEYNGRQHYEPINWFGGNKAFNKRKLNDNIKEQFCYTNNIKFIKIRYNDNIVNILMNNEII